MSLPLMVLIGISVLYIICLALSGGYFFRYFKTRDKCSLWIALLGLLGIPGFVLVSFLVFGLIAKYTGHIDPYMMGGEPCGLMSPCPVETHELRDKIIMVAWGVAYLGSLIYSVVSFYRFYKTKNKCSLWLALLFMVGLPGILVLYGLLAYFVQQML